MKSRGSVRAYYSLSYVRERYNKSIINTKNIAFHLTSLKMTTSLSAVLEEIETGDELVEQRSIADKISLDLEPLIQKIFALKDKSEEEITERPSHHQIWSEIEDEFQAKRKAIKEYKETKQLKENVPPSRTLKHNCVRLLISFYCQILT